MVVSQFQVVFRDGTGTGTALLVPDAPYRVQAGGHALARAVQRSAAPHLASTHGPAASAAPGLAFEAAFELAFGQALGPAYATASELAFAPACGPAFAPAYGPAFGRTYGALAHAFGDALVAARALERFADRPPANTPDLAARASCRVLVGWAGRRGGSAPP